MRRLIDSTILFLAVMLSAQTPASAESLSRTLRAAGVEIELTASTSTLSTSESLELQISIELDQGSILVEEIDLQSLEDWFLLRDDFQRPMLTKRGGKRWLRSLTLAPVKTGKASLKGLVFTVRSPGQYDSIQLEATDFFITVKSLLPADHKLDKIRDIRELTPESHPEEESPAFNWLFLTGLVIGIVAIIGATKFRSRGKSQSASEALRPREISSLKHRSATMGRADAYRELMSLVQAIIANGQSQSALSLSRAELSAILSSSSLSQSLQSELDGFLSEYERVMFSGQINMASIDSLKLSKFILAVEKLAEAREVK
ncbi:MAG: hypothetical protein P1V97_23960 [Planctomycetota bacterium]|nr:hypothetical protein [Planctomycetota bacterium]